MAGLDLNLLINKGMHIETIETVLIRPTPLNQLTMSNIDELVQSLLMFNQLEPIRVRPIFDPDYQYEIVDGQRRHTAFLRIINDQLENWQDFITMECIVDSDIKDDDELEEKLVEIAAQKRDLSSKEKLWLISKRKQHFERRLAAGEKLPTNSVTNLVTESVKDVGLDREMVRRYSKIDEATPEIKADFEDGKMTVLTASKIAELPTDKQVELHNVINVESLDKKQVEEKVIELSLKERYGENFLKKVIYAAIQIVSEKNIPLTKKTNYTTLCDLIPRKATLQQKRCGAFIVNSVSTMKVGYLDIRFEVDGKKEKLVISLEKALADIYEFLPEEKLIPSKPEKHVLNYGVGDAKLEEIELTNSSIRTKVLINDDIQLSIVTNKKMSQIILNKKEKITTCLEDLDNYYHLVHQMIVCQVLMGLEVKKVSDLEDLITGIVARISNKVVE